jgi:hypothetical protein
MVIIILSIIIIILLYYSYNINLKSLRYNCMVHWTNFKIKIKKNESIICVKLEWIKDLLDNLIYILNENMLLRELVVSNKIPMRFITLLLSILQTINNFVIYLLDYLKKN